ncbi:MAG: hypothetical protein WBA38_09635 [Gordonia sp. (in: high G+C Gram-positive bacteria)]|uniref:hypothetical protein n=1 Tax=Gordonia sp. (in: high G+C Gram-positive bacteria) TaxID=84139 RepID=UPI003C72D62E
MATSMAFGAVAGSGEVFAAPQQGGIGGGDENPAPQQPGFGDQGSPQQGGLTPAPQPPAPAPEPVPSTPGPLGLPAAPSAPQSEWTYPAPSYEGAYNPNPLGIHAPNPNAPTVKRVAPKPQTLRIGNFEMANKDVPNFPNKEGYIDWANGWAAYSEQQIANGLVAMGMAEEDEASRQAAAIVMGAAGAGAIGGAVAFTATTLAVGMVTVPLGAVAGGVVPWAGPFPLNVVSIAGGAAIGAGIAVSAGVVAGVGTAIVAGLIGGAAGWALGTGDKGNNIKRPDGLPKNAPQDGTEQDSGINQFELRLAKDDAARAGLPSVEYVVTERGDVKMTVGTTKLGWTAEQAQGPLALLGPNAPAAINDGVVDATDRAADAIKGLQVGWPQEAQQQAAQEAPAPAYVGSHRKQSA